MFAARQIARHVGLAAVVVAGLAAIATAPATGAPPGARAAHALSVRDEGHLHMVGEPNGSSIVEEGPVTGTIPGRVRVYFDIGPTLNASFTIYSKNGAIKGHGSASLHSSGVYSTFGGSLAVSHGTGLYARAHGSGGLYGAINRRTYRMTVQTIGTLYY